MTNANPTENGNYLRVLCNCGDLSEPYREELSVTITTTNGVDKDGRPKIQEGGYSLFELKCRVCGYYVQDRRRTTRQ